MKPCHQRPRRCLAADLLWHAFGALLILVLFLAPAFGPVLFR